MGRDKRGWVGAFISFSFSTNVSKPRCWALITPRGQRKTSKKGGGESHNHDPHRTKLVGRRACSSLLSPSCLMMLLAVSLPTHNLHLAYALSHSPSLTERQLPKKKSKRLDTA